MSSRYYNIDYRFTSSLDDDSASSYITSCKGNILEVDIETEKEISIQLPSQLQTGSYILVVKNKKGKIVQAGKFIKAK